MLSYRTLSLFLVLTSSSLTHATELADFYFEAIKSDPRLASSKAEVGVSEAQKRQSLASLLPQVALNNSISKIRYQNDGSDVVEYTGERHSLSLTQQVYNRELWLDNKIHKSQVEQSKAELANVTASVALDITQRYVAVLSAENRLKLTKEQIKSTLTHLGLLKSRYSRQLALKTEVLDVEARLQLLRIDEIDVQNSVYIARESLTEIINREVVESLGEFVDEIPYKKTMSSSDFVDYALKNSSILRSIEAEVESAELGLSKQNAGHLPQLNFQLSAQQSNIGFENAPNSDTDSYSASLNLTIPIYSGGSVSARAREYRKRIIIAKQKYERHKRELVKLVRESYFNTESGWKRIKASRQAIKSTVKSNEAMNKSFDYGTVTVVDVLDSLNDKLEAEHNFKQAQYDFIVNYIELQQLTGLLTEDTMKATGKWQKHKK